MYVMKDFANGGIGRPLVDEALAAAQRMHGIEIINLTVTADNLPAGTPVLAAGAENFGQKRAR